MIALEQLADGSLADRNFQKLRQLVPDFGGQSVGIRYGAATVTWPGGTATSNTKVVTHGLGATPVNVQITMGSKADIYFVQGFVSSVGATTFSVNLGALNDTATVPNTATTVVYWVVIG